MRNALPAIVMALTVPSASSQCGSIGPDLVVADLTTPTVFANSGGVVAFMPRVSLCTVGSVPAGWSASSADHPALLFTLYRFHLDGGVGRFEAIGQSWAHHQTSALQMALCCTCTPAGIQELGAGCSTTSSAGAVGSQVQLGQRASIDALTGAFAWPLGNPSPSSSLDRRLQVAAADLATPGARYFLEAQIVSGDDATAGNRANNASYREVVVGAGPTLAYAGATIVGLPAVTVWPFVDSNAVVAATTVPGEGGTLRLGHAVSDLGDGWHAYVYVLHDLDSFAGARSFAIPIAPGVHVRGAAFHGPATHSGDPIDDAPWSVSFADGVLTFATADAATDPFANGLRAGSAFTFRFEASAPPHNGVATVARFRPGVPDAFPIAARVPAGIAGAAFCFGDGSGTACPCGNASAVGGGAGCRNSLGTAGRLARSGTSSIASDTFTLHAGGMPDSSALYFQGTAFLRVVFGDGLRCAGGVVTRLGTQTNVGGASAHPAPGDFPISAAGGAIPGAVRTYQVWYRNAAAFCTTSTFNLTNGVATTWVP
jgi:hypothetical protein